MDGYILWSIVGAACAIVLVFLSYMGFFSKVLCTAEEVKEIILAYDNYEAPYIAMDHQSRVFEEKLAELCGDTVPLTKQVNIYYDDPRFTSEQCRWGIAYEVPEEVVDMLALNNISCVRIPPGRCLSIVFPFRNVLSYGLGARKAFDTMALTADKNGITISTPPMEVYLKGSQAIQYILYLDNIDIIQSMCESPFSEVAPNV